MNKKNNDFLELIVDKYGNSFLEIFEDKHVLVKNKIDKIDLLKAIKISVN